MLLNHWDLLNKIDDLMREEIFPAIWKKMLKTVIVGSNLGIGWNPNIYFELKRVDEDEFMCLNWNQEGWNLENGAVYCHQSFITLYDFSVPYFLSWLTVDDMYAGTKPGILVHRQPSVRLSLAIPTVSETGMPQLNLSRKNDVWGYITMPQQPGCLVV